MQSTHQTCTHRLNLRMVSVGHQWETGTNYGNAGAIRQACIEDFWHERSCPKMRAKRSIAACSRLLVGSGQRYMLNHSVSIREDAVRSPAEFQGEGPINH
jgi:hypothetical protein